MTGLDGLLYVINNGEGPRAGLSGYMYSVSTVSGYTLVKARNEWFGASPMAAIP
jgi:hypothetical protein